jgi:threonine dehydrogenase-like Zn-dependent dehydrogenase
MGAHRIDFCHDVIGPIARLMGLTRSKGVARLNGRCIGRYWLTPGTNELPDWQVPTIRLKYVGEPLQQCYNVPIEWLQDQNMLILFEEIGRDPSRVSPGSVMMKPLGDSQVINTRKVGTMKVLVWHGPRSMTVEQQEVPKPGPGEALVQVKAVGICGSEVEGYLGQNNLRFPPLIMGHEFSGEIVESGSMIGESPTPGIGQRVTVNPLVSCGACMYCMADLTHVCPNRKLIGAHRPGAFADYVVVPQRSVIPLPDTLPDTLAALTEPFAVSIHGVELAHLRPEDAVVVWGAGTIGLLAICAARQAHPTRIIAVDTNEARLASASAAGATTVLDARSDPIVEQVRSLVSDVPHVVVFDAVGRSITRVASAAVAGPCGQVILLGLHEL